jgi:hypothetical protein
MRVEELRVILCRRSPHLNEAEIDALIRSAQVNPALVEKYQQLARKAPSLHRHADAPCFVLNGKLIVREGVQQ